MNDLLSDAGIGDQVARRGNGLSRTLARWALRAMGWRVTGAIPNLPRMVFIGAPHTSNMDGVVSILTLTALGLRAGTMIKHSAFKGPMGPVLRFFGAIPINRASAHGVVAESVSAMKSSKSFILLIAPEGTRTQADDWKRGFYLISNGAEAPIVPCAIDYKRKVVTFGAPVAPGGSYDETFATLMNFYGAHSYPRHSTRASAPICATLGLPFQKARDPGEKA